MKEFEGTPAPWFAIDIAGYANIQDGQYYEDNNILDSEDVGEEVVKANVKLILASHDLLEALKVFTDDYESGYRMMTPAMIYKAQLAISKALGD